MYLTVHPGRSEHRTLGREGYAPDALVVAGEYARRFVSGHVPQADLSSRVASSSNSDHRAVRRECGGVGIQSVFLRNQFTQLLAGRDVPQVETSHSGYEGLTVGR